MDNNPLQPLPLDETESQKFVRSMRLSRMLLPIGFGLVAVGYLFYRQFDLEKFRAIEWTGHAFAWIGLAFLLLLQRY